jgi:nucleoside-diphosphate-sugar epimerase
MKILITGVSGFIGKNLAISLSEDNYVIGLYNNKFPTELVGKKNITVIKTDLRKGLLLDDSVDLIIHAASVTPAKSSEAEEIRQGNSLLMKQILVWCQKNPPKNFLFLSSMSVYGDADGIIDELSPSKNINSYGQEKLDCESLLNDFSKRPNNFTRVLVMRLPGVVGLGAHETFIPKLVKNIAQEIDVNIYSKNALFNNIVHVNDVASFAMEWSSRNNLDIFKIINVAADDSITLEKLCSVVQKKLNKAVGVSESFAGRPPFTISTRVASELGFPKRGTLEIIEHYLRDFLNSY